jgi:hypothetical protein
MHMNANDFETMWAQCLALWNKGPLGLCKGGLDAHNFVGLDEYDPLPEGTWVILDFSGEHAPYILEGGSSCEEVCMRFIKKRTKIVVLEKEIAAKQAELRALIRNS